jgi:imidazoleglycerol-phosphate dehydratase
MQRRAATVKRETKETSISIELDIDGQAEAEITTGIRMFDHLLSQLSQHGVFNLRLSATSQDSHHLVEDVALCLGRAFNQALGTREGIVRMSHAVVPMDDALALSAVDLSGRGYAIVEIDFDEKNVADLPVSMITHFLETFACEARLNLHVCLLRGKNDHHKAEATFKALARSLDMATRYDERLRGKIPSTKSVLD